uniref:Glycosyltransferase 6 n=1 Tax=Oryza glumipatula TaxID=40148 RepID=A0A0E0BK28_9ORYZ
MAASETAPFGVSAASKGGGGVAGARAQHGQLAVAGRVHDALVFAAGAVAAVLVLLATASFLSPMPVTNLVAFRSLPVSVASTSAASAAIDADVGVRGGPGAAGRTFYDDSRVSYAVEVGRRGGITGWDARRAAWMRLRYPRGLNATAAGRERVVMVSGSQAPPCRGEGGDHLLLRFLKNKVDYCRLHGVELLYNNALLQPRMLAYWAKIPAVRAAMLAHPDAEWVWWVDADAVFTDMDFSLPLHKYKDHNLVVYGWNKEVYGERSWVGLNAGVFLIRNCQWSLDFMDAWARMGPASPEYARWGSVLHDTLRGKSDKESDDQSALVYLLSEHEEKWGTKTYLEKGYFFQGYWVEVVDRLDDIAARYEAAERRSPAAAHLRRRHAEREHARYAAARNAAAAETGAALPGPAGGGQSGWRRPFVTHFTGCQPCGGEPNKIYSKKSCADGMNRALNFADDQVLRNYGYRHKDPLSDEVRPLPFDYPAAR